MANRCTNPSSTMQVQERCTRLRLRVKAAHFAHDHSESLEPRGRSELDRRIHASERLYQEENYILSALATHGNANDALHGHELVNVERLCFVHIHVASSQATMRSRPGASSCTGPFRFEHLQDALRNFHLEQRAHVLDLIADRHQTGAGEQQADRHIVPGQHQRSRIAGR